MKVLCLYNHPEYGAPMVRSAAAFDAFGVSMTVVRVPAAEDSQVKELAKHSFDVLLLQEPPVYERVLDCGRPVVLLERVDGAQLRASRQYLADDRVAGVIKSYVFRNRKIYNMVPDRAHIQILSLEGVQCDAPIYHDLPPDTLSPASLEKLRVGYSGFGCHDVLRQCLDMSVDFDAPRHWDVHFAGTVSYERSEVEAHRCMAFNAIQSWSGPSLVSAGRSIQRPEYYSQMRDAKAVLCPWGWGEATYRDYEAWALGAVVIKPDTSYVEAWPDVYRAGETYVVCEPDFTDAHDKIANVVEKWDDYRPMRERARQLVVDAWQPHAIARRMSQLLKEICHGQ